MSIQGERLPVEELQDDALVTFFLRSCDNAYFAELFRRYGKIVFHSCMAFHRNSAIAEDVTQETFLRAYENMASFTGGSFRSWILRIARNGCIDHWRRRKPEISIEDANLQTVARPGKLGTLIQDVLVQLDQELEALPANQKSCLELKAQGFSYEETAEKIGGSTEDVRSHLQNGRRTLRLRMAGLLANIS